MEWNEKSVRTSVRSKVGYRTIIAPSNTPAALTSSPPCDGSSTAPAAPVLAPGDTLADELMGAVAEGDATDEFEPEPEPEGAEAEAEAEADEGVKLGNNRDVGLEAATQNCSTSASAETTSEGQEIRGQRRGLLPDTLV
ncbi:hypothetical protein C8R44DRAFT_880151 [Mycena epipterygia]|nr:hypothetical protein C8R44DRAFT_880151 [Mycena epipterygia]